MPCKGLILPVDLYASILANPARTMGTLRPGAVEAEDVEALAIVAEVVEEASEEASEEDAAADEAGLETEVDEVVVEEVHAVDVAAPLIVAGLVTFLARRQPSRAAHRPRDTIPRSGLVC